MTCPHRRARITTTLSHEVEKRCEDCGAELPVYNVDRQLAEPCVDIVVEQMTWKDVLEQDDAAVDRLTA